MRNNTVFKGCATAMVTPFTENGVDYTSFKKLIDFQIANGVDALLLLGTTGEPPTMTENERREVMEFAVDYIKGVPVILGVGCNCTKDTVDMAKFAARCGAEGLLVVTPYYNRCTQEGIFQHYKAVSDAVNVPIISYNVPARTGVNIMPKTAARLAELENVVAIKEASGNVAQITETARLIEGKMDLYSGDDALVLPLLALGGLGVISVVSNILPSQMTALCHEFMAGNIEEARRLQFMLNPLINAIFVETNPIPVKTALNLMGLNAGRLRLPLTEMSADNLEILKAELAALKLIG